MSNPKDDDKDARAARLANALMTIGQDDVAPDDWEDRVWSTINKERTAELERKALNTMPTSEEWARLRLLAQDEANRTSDRYDRGREYKEQCQRLAEMCERMRAIVVDLETPLPTREGGR